ncbi:MAG: SIR2 family protein [Candidatus Omnitrophica bacterium]|nr:SIR2 family protein [Candidatus Omnitrophota bacterium]
MSGTDKDIKKLIEAVEREDLIVFVGAGVSRLVGGPSWEKLAKEYLKHLYLNKAINYSTHQYLYKEDTRKLISICREIEKINPKKPQFDINSVLNNIDKSKELQFCSDIYTHLCNFSSIFVTTNYDCYIDNEIVGKINLKKPQEEVQNPSSGPIIYHYEDIHSTSILKNKNVIHIHGSVNDPKKGRRYVLTIQDYFEAYDATTSMLPKFLEEIFDTRTVLFIGYGLEEYEILEYMLKRKRDMRHFMLYPVLKEEEAFFHFQESYYAGLGVKLIKFNISKLGHRQLYYEVKELASKVGPNARSKEKLAKLKLVDEIL